MSITMKLDPELLREVWQETSGGLPFTLRQLWYGFRRRGQEIEWNDFKKAIGDFQTKHGSIPNLIGPPIVPRDVRGWPMHRSSVYYPDGREDHYDTSPIGKVKGKFYCKYCYTTHRDWWQMDPKEYSLGEDEPLDVILCGKCAHTSRREFAEP